MRPRPKPLFVPLLVLFLAYALTARAGLLLGAVSGFATFVWPPTGIALAALLIYGYRLSPAIFAAALLVNYVTGAPPLVAAGIALGNTLEALTGAYLLQRFARFEPSLERVSDVIALIGYAALASTLVSASVGVASLLAGGTVAPAALGPTWVAWWVGDILGDLVALPFVLVLLGQVRFSSQIVRRVEGALLVLFLALVNLVTFSSLTTAGSIAHASLAYLLFLPLIWAALRFDQATVTTAIFATSVCAVAGTALGFGPFIGATLPESLFALQLFMGTMAVTSLIMGAAVAERRKSASELGAQVAEDEALIEGIGDGVLAVDPAGRVMKANARALAMLGWGPLQIFGAELDTVLKAVDEQGEPVPPEARPMHQVLASGERVSTAKLSYVRRDGSTFPVAITVNPITSAGALMGAVEVFRDITSEREVERAKSSFIALVSHQLRTPLTLASWYSERLHNRQGATLDDKSREDLTEIERSIRQMSQLVGDILHVSSLESGTLKIAPVPVALGTFLQRIIREFDPLVHEKTCHVQFEEPVPVPAIPIDADLMREMVYNLLSNAVQYSSGPRCDVLVSLKQGSGTYVDTYVVAVRDHGIGISFADRVKIFQRFYRTEAARQMSTGGTGLGLYLVRQIAEATGASVWVESKEGEGSTFSIAIPKTGMKGQSGDQLFQPPAAGY